MNKWYSCTLTEPAEVERLRRYLLTNLYKFETGSGDGFTVFSILCAGAYDAGGIIPAALGGDAKCA